MPVFSDMQYLTLAIIGVVAALVRIGRHGELRLETLFWLVLAIVAAAMYSATRS